MPRRMLSIDRCRKLIGPSCGLEDSEIELVRSQLYALAEIVVDQLERRPLPSDSPGQQGILDSSNDAQETN